MDLSYNFVRSVSQEEFDRIAPTSQELAERYTRSDREDVAKIARLLDVREETLVGRDNYYLEKTNCENCGRLLTMYDFVFTAIVDAEHTKSLILHTLVGTKRVINQPRPIRCSNCGRVKPQGTQYFMPNSYGCYQK